jgi:hypothetical protein
MIRVVKTRAKVYLSLNVLVFKKYSISIQSLVIFTIKNSSNFAMFPWI